MLDLDSRNRLIVENIDFADQIASNLFKKTPKWIYLDELKSAAYLGLVVAASRYEGAVPFKGYACHRISGEIMDYMRFRYRGALQFDENFDLPQ